MESTLPRNHDDHIAEEGCSINSLTHHNLVRKLIPMHQAMTIPDGKAAVDKEWEKLEKIPAWQMDKVKSKKDVILEAHKEKRKVHFAALMDICPLKNIGTKAPKIQWTSRAPRRLSKKDDSDAHAVCTEQGSSASQMTAAKSDGCSCEITRMRLTSRRRSISLHPGKMEDAPRWLKIPKSECPDTWIRLPRHKWRKSWSNIEDPLFFFSNEICMVTHLQASYGRGSWRKFCWSLDRKKLRTGNCLFLHRKQGLFLIQCTWMTLKSLEESRIWLQCGRN